MCSVRCTRVRFLDETISAEKGERMPSQSPYRIEPSEEERAILEKRARSHTAAYWEVVRARIVLLSSEGVSNKEIASRLDTSPQVVWKWRKRFHQEGLEGL
jgi:DNA-binding NarL/FixJ family response regulator